MQSYLISLCKVAAILVAAVTLNGCASGPSMSQMQSSLPALAGDKGRIFIYRTSVLGAAIQPEVRVNGDVVGSAKPKGFMVVDRPAGQYQISSSTEVTRTLSLTLAPGQTRYVRLGVSMGFFAGHVYPELVEATEGARDLESCSFIGGK